MLLTPHIRTLLINKISHVYTCKRHLEVNLFVLLKIHYTPKTHVSRIKNSNYKTDYEQTALWLLVFILFYKFPYFTKPLQSVYMTFIISKKNILKKNVQISSPQTAKNLKEKCLYPKYQLLQEGLQNHYPQ